MVLHVRGRHTSKDIWKPGERCQVTGTYRCGNCGNRGQDIEASVEEGEIFPMCANCNDWDMGWRLVQKS